jgi:Na+/melibiose symporter-like transporter
VQPGHTLCSLLTFSVTAGLPLGIFYALLWQTIVMPEDFKFLYADVSKDVLILLLMTPVRYYTIMFILFNTAQACVSVPYTSLTPELTPRYELNRGCIGFYANTSPTLDTTSAPSSRVLDLSMRSALAWLPPLFIRCW